MINRECRAIDDSFLLRRHLDADLVARTHVAL